MEHGHRVERLVLVGPAGLRDNKQPTADVLGLPRGEIAGVAGVELRRDQAVPAGQAGPRLHGRPLSRRRHAGAAVVGASLRHETAALSASADHADAAGLGRRGPIDPGRSRPRSGGASFPRPTFRSSKAPATSCSTRSAKPSMQCSNSCPDITASPSVRLSALSRVFVGITQVTDALWVFNSLRSAANHLPRL